MNGYGSPRLFSVAPMVACSLLLLPSPGPKSAREGSSSDDSDMTGCIFYDAVEPGYDSAELTELPEYPVLARTEGLEGKVVVSVKVVPTGEALDVVVRRSSDTIFEANALDAARKLHYVPAMQNGRPVRVWKTFAIDFELDETATADSVEIETEEEPREYGMDEYVPNATPPGYDRGELRSHLEVSDTMRERCGSWRVVVSAQVDRDGTLLQAVARSATDKLFIEPTIKAIRQTTFTSGMKNDEPIRMWTTLLIDIELED